jgi:hypothetical protein
VKRRDGATQRCEGRSRNDGGAVRDQRIGLMIFTSLPAENE